MATMQKGLPPPEDLEPETQIFIFYAVPTGSLAAFGFYAWAAIYFIVTLGLTILFLRDLDP